MDVIDDMSWSETCALEFFVEDGCTQLSPGRKDIIDDWTVGLLQRCAKSPFCWALPIASPQHRFMIRVDSPSPSHTKDIPLGCG